VVAIATTASLQNSTLVYSASLTMEFLTVFTDKVV